MSSICSVRIRWADEAGDDGHDVLIAGHCSPDDLPEGYCDDDIFFYGMEERSVRSAQKSGELCENEWQITEIHDVAYS